MGSNLVPKAAAPSKPQPLAPDDVRYVVLEGGGGKGFAYVGAVQVLERLGILSNVQGFGGASAGAITALMLSMNMGSKDIEGFLDKTDFDAFFDPPLPRLQPYTGPGSVPVEDTAAEHAFLNQPTLLSFAALFEGDAAAVGGARLFAQVLETLLPALGSLQFIGQVFTKEVATQLVSALRLILETQAPVGPILWAGGRHYLAYLPRDMGLFSGDFARRTFNDLVLTRMGRTARRGHLRSPRETVTFSEHFARFGRKLLVTGTNLRSGKTVVFSKDDTPLFPVSDAVRISMGLPFIYKPYVIKDGGDGWAPCGVYVDGGVWNNLPYREFDAEARAGSRAGSRSARLPSKPSTLGLRLEIEPPQRVATVADVAATMLSKAVFGTGESQVLDKDVAQTVLLDTRGLKLLQFNPDPATRAVVGKRARRQVMRYFGLGDFIAVQDRDDEDDLKTYQLRRAAESCTPMG